MTTIDIPPAQSGEINFASPTLATAELKLRIALMFGDPISEELADSVD
ncbi:hypothetical protein [Rhodococcus sp. IEGM 1379]|nr:hypothetical protein [Rhodococcus sp. IEGM 1379]MDI9913745.1 hypothetical protein [Rhodococcus sp. IEGM 1379]